MPIRLRVPVPPAFRPQHQVGLVLRKVGVASIGLGEDSAYNAPALVLEGSYGPWWDRSWWGRATVHYVADPTGFFEIAVHWEGLMLTTALGMALGFLLFGRLEGTLNGRSFLVVLPLLGVSAGILAVRALLLRRSVARAIVDVVSRSTAA